MLALLLLLAVKTTTHTATLNWKPSADAGTTVNVYRSTGGCSGSFQRIASGVVAGGPYKDANLSAGMTYSYQVTAVLKNTESPPSACVSTPVTAASPTNITIRFK